MKQDKSEEILKRINEQRKMLQVINDNLKQKDLIGSILLFILGIAVGCMLFQLGIDLLR